MRHAIYALLLTLLACDTAYAQAYIGRWYGETIKQCADKNGGRLGVLAFTAKNEVFGKETPCRIVGATPKGSGTELRMRCQGDSGTFTELVEVKDGRLKVTNTFEGKRMT